MIIPPDPKDRHERVKDARLILSTELLHPIQINHQFALFAFGRHRRRTLSVDIRRATDHDPNRCVIFLQIAEELVHFWLRNDRGVVLEFP